MCKAGERGSRSVMKRKFLLKVSKEQQLMMFRFIRYQHLKTPNRIILHTGLNYGNDYGKVAEDILTLAESIKCDESPVFISGLISTADKKK